MESKYSSFRLDYARQRAALKALAARDNLDPETRNIAISTLESTLEVSNGEAIGPDQFSQCAVIQGPTDFGSGVLVGGNIVLTAGHVVREDAPRTAFTVRVPTASTTSGNVFTLIADAVRPPDDGDLAVLIISGKPGLQRLRLANETDYASPDLRQPASGLTVCGFGIGFPPNHPEQRSEGVKRMIQVPILEDQGADFIAGDTNGPIHNVCLKDSGGPAFATSQPDLLIGIVTGPLTTGEAEIGGCGISRRALYVKIPYYRGWIVDTAKRFGTDLN